MKLSLVLAALPAVVCIFTWPAISYGHDFWIEPSSHRATVNELVTIRLRVGDAFDAQPFKRNPNHIREFFVARGSSVEPIGGAPNDEPAGSFRPQTEGLHIVVYRSGPNVTSLPIARFEKYIHEEAFSQIPTPYGLPARTQANVDERFWRYSKAMVSVGEPQVTDAEPAFGLKFELVSERNPFALGVGDELPIRLLFDGRPLANRPLRLISDSSEVKMLENYTDADGRAIFKIPSNGRWLARSVHLRAAPAGAKVEWESFWATLTFTIGD